MGKRKDKLQRIVGEKAESAIYKMSKSHVQPPAKPVYNNRIVFIAGFVTGAIITLWVTLFMIKFLPLVLR
jgi:hypothetical protein